MKLLFKYFSFFLSLSILCFWAYKLQEEGGVSPVQTYNYPDEYLLKVGIEKFNPQGKLIQKLNAKTWVYSHKKNKSHFEEPRLTIYKPDETVWNINALRGEAINKSLNDSPDIIDLYNDVIVARLGNNFNQALKLETEYLQYYPGIQQAKTDKYVKMTKPGVQITGTGLNALLDKGFVELLENVKTYYSAE
ncbi:MAG: hypothetical protein JWM09_595 [Francisellaceae bacterium]|nr:hypothetical protein [Francisellaceae bacterium]